jgi:hypothetical protein
LIGFFYFTDQSGTLFTNWLVNSNMSFCTSQRTCELRNEVRNICGQSFVKSTVKSSPVWGIFHSSSCVPAPGHLHYHNQSNQMPGCVPGGGGMVTPGIDSCIMLPLCFGQIKIIVGFRFHSHILYDWVGRSEKHFI